MKYKLEVEHHNEDMKIAVASMEQEVKTIKKRAKFWIMINTPIMLHLPRFNFKKQKQENEQKGEKDGTIE